jgi:hypothetical protein
MPNQSALVNARRACLLLASYASGETYAIGLSFQEREAVADLVNEFGRLDRKERKQARAGKRAGKLGAEYGKLGGRPRDANPSPRALKAREQREKKKGS